MILRTRSLLFYKNWRSLFGPRSGVEGIFFEVIDRESPTTGVWVLYWVIYNSIINEISSIAREVDQGASSRL